MADTSFTMATVGAPTGIPESLLVECSADDPARCVTRDGRFVKRIVANGYIPLGEGVDEASRAPMPEDWKCGICHLLLEKAVQLDCCKTRACGNCVEKYVTEKGAECFGCDDYISLDDLEPLTQLREDIAQYKKTGAVPPQTGTAGQKRPREE